MNPEQFFDGLRRNLVPELLRRVARAAAADPEPSPRFSPAWREWQRREWLRLRARIELAEAESLTCDSTDPAPLASEGFEAFMNWATRQPGQRSRMLAYRLGARR